MQGRGAFYEEVGALRDVVQNHLFQIVALLAMEPPLGHGRQGAARREGAGVRRGRHARAVATSCAASSTATATSRGSRRTPTSRRSPRCRLHIDSWRWAGVPWYLRAGKELPGARAPRCSSSCKRAAAAGVRGLRMPEVGTATTCGSGSARDLDRASAPGRRCPARRWSASCASCSSRNEFPDEMSPYERLLGDAIAGRGSAVRARGRRRRGVAGRRQGPDPPPRRPSVRPRHVGTQGGRSPDRTITVAGTTRSCTVTNVSVTVDEQKQAAGEQAASTGSSPGMVDRARHRQHRRPRDPSPSARASQSGELAERARHPDVDRERGAGRGGRRPAHDAGRASRRRSHDRRRRRGRPATSTSSRARAARCSTRRSSRRRACARSSSSTTPSSSPQLGSHGRAAGGGRAVRRGGPRRSTSTTWARRSTCGAVPTTTCSSPTRATGSSTARSRRSPIPPGSRRSSTGAPGIVEHGLFLGLATDLLVASADGRRAPHRARERAARHLVGAPRRDRVERSPAAHRPHRPAADRTRVSGRPRRCTGRSTGSSSRSCSPARCLRARETARLAGLRRCGGARRPRRVGLRRVRGLTTRPDPRAGSRAGRSSTARFRAARPRCRSGARAVRILDLAAEADGPVLLFAHGHFLRVLTAVALELGPRAGARFVLDPATISVIGTERETRALTRWNEPTTRL